MKSGLPHSLQIAADGEEAIGYLSRQGRFANRRRYSFPVLMLLDLMLPKVTGLDVLEWKQRRPELQNLPVIVLVTVQHDSAVDRAMELGAVSCLIKPVVPENLRAAIDQFDTYWLAESDRAERDAVSRPGSRSTAGEISGAARPA